MGYRCQDTFGGDVFSELHGSRKFGGSVPALDARPGFYDGNIFVGVGTLDVLGDLSACHRHIQVVPFQMQAEDRAVFFFHQLGAGFGCLLNHGDGGGGEGGENTGRSIFHMGFDGCTEGIFGTFHKITASTAMSMNLHATGEYIHTFYVYQLCTDYGKVTVGHFQYFSVSDEYRAVFKPSLRGKDAGVDKLGQHRIWGLELLN